MWFWIVRFCMDWICKSPEIDQHRCGICRLAHQKSPRCERLQKGSDMTWRIRKITQKEGKDMLKNKKDHPVEGRPQERCWQLRCWGLFCRTKPRKEWFCCNTRQRSGAQGTLVVHPHWLCSCTPWWGAKEGGDGWVGVLVKHGDLTKLKKIVEKKSLKKVDGWEGVLVKHGKPTKLKKSFYENWRQKVEKSWWMRMSTCQTWKAHKGPWQQPFWPEQELHRVSKSLAP